MNLVTTKRRIIQYIDYKCISVKIFLSETGIKRGFLDSDKLESSVSDIFLSIIIERYPEINLEWLITGKGTMLKTNNNPLSGFLHDNIEPIESINYKELSESRKETIESLKRENELLREKVQDKSSSTATPVDR